MTATTPRTTFAELTTLRVGGPVGRLVTATSTEQAIETVRECDQRDEPVLVIGGGSNLVMGDDGWAGTVVQMATGGLAIDGELVTADAGVEWDLVVRTSLAEGLAGLEGLSGVPGSTGGTPVQNVGAYGCLTSDVLDHLTVYDRTTGRVEVWTADQCHFGPHRQSILKRAHRWVVLAVTYRLRRGAASTPVRYAEVAKALGITPGASADALAVREAVLSLRRSKGMVLDPDDHDTWSVGSFFLNPVVPEVPAAAAQCPQFPDEHGVKLSAGWLIDHAGFPRGYGSGRVTLSTRHALAITNRGGATAAEITAFAAHIRAGVRDRFGVWLEPECDLINCTF